MNKILACLLVVLSSSVLSAALPEMTVADHGKSDYKIVYAETGTAEVNAFIKDSAKTLQEIVKFASGAELPVLPESAFKADSPAIFVGRVSALKKIPKKNAGPAISWPTAETFFSGATTAGAARPISNGTMLSVHSFWGPVTQCCCSLRNSPARCFWSCPI